MSSKRLTQGQSKYTPLKQAGLGSVLGMNMKLVQKVFENNPYCPRKYFHIDLTAGCGLNEEYETDGSPLIFRKTLHGHMDYRAFFCDMKNESCKKLKRYFEGDRKSFIFCGDYASFLTIAPNLIASPQVIGFKQNPEYAYGTVYLDPNGPKLISDGMQQLAEFFSVCPRMDFVVNISATALKRTSHFGWSYTLQDLMQTVNKEHWQIKAVNPGDRWQWTILVGRNRKYSGWKREGFYEVGSPEGKLILDGLNSKGKPAFYQPQQLELALV